MAFKLKNTRDKFSDQLGSICDRFSTPENNGNTVVYDMNDSFNELVDEAVPETNKSLKEAMVTKPKPGQKRKERESIWEMLKSTPDDILTTDPKPQPKKKEVLPPPKPFPKNKVWWSEGFNDILCTSKFEDHENKVWWSEGLDDILCTSKFEDHDQSEEF